ncbi:glycosyltransferase family 4 protein [candidate division WOR-3 bacterium]|nr:glycosyltransferase family 4 protein [candidate division WOR-3 bacterium]
MRIAVVSFRTFEYGGVERYAYELINYLSKKVEVHLFTHTFSGDTNATVHIIPSIGKKDLFSVNSFMLFLKKKIDRNSFDIIHSMGPLYLYPDIVTTHICQKRLLLEKENFFEDFSFLRKYYWKVRTHAAVNFQKRSFTNANKVIAVSSMLAKEIKKEYGIKNVLVAHPGIDNKFFQHVDVSERKKKRESMAIDDDAVVILFVGGQWERKGLKHVINSLSGLTGNVMLLVVGRGDKKRYLNLAKRCGVDNRIIFLGFKKNVIDCYRISDILVLPSSYESFGYPVLEAMAMGLPVVVSDQVGASELIEEGKTGYIVRKGDDEKAFLSKIKKLIDIGPGSFSRRTREKAEEFRWERKIEEILSVYEEILRSKSS